MRQTAGQLPPGSDPLGLHQALPLLEELSCHAVKGFGQRSQFVGRIHRNLRVPVSGSDLSRRLRQLPDRSRNPRRCPSTEKNGQNDADACRQQSRRADAIAQLHIGTPRVTHQQNPQHLVVLAAQRDGVHALIVCRIVRPMNQSGGFLPLLLDLRDQRGQQVWLVARCLRA